MLFESCNKERQFTKDLSKLLNNYNMDTATDTPDYVLSIYLVSCLKTYHVINYNNRVWHGEENKGG